MICSRRALPMRLVPALVLTVVLLAGPAQAVPINDFRKEITELEQQTQNLSIQYKAETASLAQLSESRLVDAQVLYSLKDYSRAAILFLDYVNKYKNSPGYAEALFFLADCLYHKRDFFSAKRYFRQIVTEGTQNRYYQEALQRLVELSLRTGETTYIDQYLERLAHIPAQNLKPSVPYVRAKYYYFKKDARAIPSLQMIPRGHKYYLHSQYFLGAAQVRRKDYAAAKNIFTGMLNYTPKTKSEKHIKDLAYLGLGRMLYEEGKTAKAIEMYDKVTRLSPEFDAALYEIAWAYIKEKKFRKARRALELLVLANPDSPFAPEVKVLQGNLLIRLNQWGQATRLFSQSREKFVPVYKRMNQVLSRHQDPTLFFDLLLNRDQSRFAIKINVPKLAIHWVREKHFVKKAMGLVRDVREIQSSITEATKLIKKLEQAINSPAKIKIFPEFATAKARALEVENRLVLVRMQILQAERDLVMGKATGEQLSQLHNFAAQRSQLEQEIKKLPTNVEGYKVRQRGQLKKILEMEKQLNRLSILVQSLRAQLVAIEKYFNDTSEKREKGVHESFAKEAGNIKSMIIGLQTEVNAISQGLSNARSMAGVGGSEEVAERTVKERYIQIVEQEHQLLSTLRAGLDGERSAQFDQLVDLMRRASQINTFITDFDVKLEALVEEKLASVRTSITDEKTKVTNYEIELADYKDRTDRVAGALTYHGFRSVAKRFYEIVVRADVGIIDVAWALKDAKTKEVSRLVRQRRMDIKLLEDEFREVLRDE